MHLCTTICGESLTLLPEKAIFWEAQGMLMVADAHFGKAATFRARGIPVPTGTTAENLAALDAMIERWAPRRIVFLGDFLHAREARALPTMAALLAWRARHAGLELTLVRGNHDEHAGPLPVALGVVVVKEPYTVGPFALRHYPGSDASGYVLAGHLHPAVRLYGPARDSERLPCFWFGATGGVLPAFGAFTGAAVIAPGPGESVFLAGPDRVRHLPVQRPPVP